MISCYNLHFARPSEERDFLSVPVHLHADAVELVFRYICVTCQKCRGLLDGGEWCAERDVAEAAGDDGVASAGLCGGERRGQRGQKGDERAQTGVLMVRPLQGAEQRGRGTSELANERLADQTLPEANAPASKDETSYGSRGTTMLSCVEHLEGGTATVPERKDTMHNTISTPFTAFLRYSNQLPNVDVCE